LNEGDVRIDDLTKVDGQEQAGAEAAGEGFLQCLE
jgi:hypothetical protein